MIRIVSGGQTGVDRGAMHAAIELGISIGGWAPRGWIAEDCGIPQRYRDYMIECPIAGYEARTRANVRDSDGTLIVISHPGQVSGGTHLTESYATAQRKPCWRMMLGDTESIWTAGKWILDHRINTLNVAGPRESKAPGIQRASYSALRILLTWISRDAGY